MEDYILREIDKIGELILMIARRMGLFLDEVPDYSITDVQSEFDKEKLALDLETVLELDNPVLYLVENEKVSDKSLETLADILFHSDLDDARKNAFLEDAIAYLDRKGYISFRLHSLQGEG